MNVGDIIIKEHNFTDAKTKIKHTETEEYVITQEDINSEIVKHFEEGKTIEEIAAEFDRELTVDEIALYDSKQHEITSQEVYKRLDEIDKEVAQARVIDDIIKGNPPHQRVLDLLSEREALLNQL